MLLKDKNIVIYGAGGSVGTAVAIAFSNEGAGVFLTDHKTAVIEKTARQINQNGGYADFAKVDALERTEVEAHLDQLILRHGHIDISFNLVGLEDVHGFPLIELGIDEFFTPVSIAMKSHFTTAKAAAKKMSSQQSGVILMLSANAAKNRPQNTGGFGVACAAIEALGRQFASELGIYNIRVVCIRSAGSPDAKGVREAFEEHARAANISLEEFEIKFAENTMLKRLPKLKEIADVAVLAASDKAGAITAAIINATCGDLSD